MITGLILRLGLSYFARPAFWLPCGSGSIPLITSVGTGWLSGWSNEFWYVQWVAKMKPDTVNSLSPVRFVWNFRQVIFKRISIIGGWVIFFCEIAMGWMSLNPTYNESTLIQVMAWCREAASHYLSHCWSHSMLPYGVTRPQSVNIRVAVSGRWYSL